MADKYRSYDVVTGKHGTAHEEWAPHAAQTEKSNEWWYITNVLRDEKGKLLFQHICPVHFAGSYYLKVVGMDPNAGPGHYVMVISISDYERGLRIDERGFAKVEDAFDAKSNAIRYRDKDIMVDWVFQGETMTLKMKAKTQELDLNMRSVSGTVWNRDSIFNIDGLVGESAKGEPLFLLLHSDAENNGEAVLSGRQGKHDQHKGNGGGMDGAAVGGLQDRLLGVVFHEILRWRQGQPLRVSSDEA